MSGLTNRDVEILDTYARAGNVRESQTRQCAWADPAQPPNAPQALPPRTATTPR